MYSSTAFIALIKGHLENSLLRIIYEHLPIVYRILVWDTEDSVQTIFYF